MIECLQIEESVSSVFLGLLFVHVYILFHEFSAQYCGCLIAFKS